MAREKKEKPIEGHDSSFDLLMLNLMMIMLAFFIMLSSMATIMDEKRMKALASVSGAFNFLPSGANFQQGKGSVFPGAGLGKQGVTAKRTAKALTNVAKMLGHGDAIHAIALDKQTVRVRLAESLLFAPGQVRLNPKMAPFLDKMADLLYRPAITQIMIQGHTDDTPALGLSFQSNWELSAARAMQVFLALSKRGVPKERMIVAGMGDAHPVAKSAGHPALNRRVDIQLKFRPVTAKGTASVMVKPTTQTGRKPRSSLQKEK